MRKRVQIALVLLLTALAGFLGWRTWRSSIAKPMHPAVVFRNKPLGAWFFGSRTNFYQEDTRRAAQTALDGVGITNAFPFLLFVLKVERGSPPIYERAYRFFPAWISLHLPYPISGDDIKFIALNHLWQMRQRLGKEQLQALTDLVPTLQNPRLRMRALDLVREKYETHLEFRDLCRRLLDDPDPAVRVEAAIPLAESAIVADPGDPRLAPILLQALGSAETQKHRVELQSYTYQQQPPGASSRALATLASGRFAIRLQDQTEVLRGRIKVALIRLRPYLSAEQQAHFEQLRFLNSSRPQSQK